MEGLNNWVDGLLVQHSVVQAVIVLSIIIAVGLILGRIKIATISLGVTFVFFVGILAGHLGFSINHDMLIYAESLGLILFVYALGLQVGPSFIASFFKGGLRLNMLAMGVVVVGTLQMLLIYWLTNVSLPEMIGIFCGAVTNTPALGAAQQTLKQLTVSSGVGQPDLALGCAVAYPMGVVGVILAIVFLRIFRGRIEPKRVSGEPPKTFIASFQLCNPAIYGRTVAAVAALIPNKFVISRVWKDGKVIIPTSDTILEEGEKILTISNESDLAPLTALFGRRADDDWNKDDIDWNKIDSELLSRQILVTQFEINGKKISQLRFRNKYGVNITRVMRSGLNLLATPDLTLQVGDRITVVGERPSLEKVEAELGNRVKSLHEPNLVAIFIGIVLGLLLGAIPFSLPGVSLPVTLGIAGGPIIIGILMGAFGPRLHMVTYTTQSANLMLRGFGISMYLACLGLSAGSQFFETVFQAQGLLWILIGFSLTIVPIILVGLYAMFVEGYDYSIVCGLLCGSMANPMALNYANSTIDNDEPSVAYATVYPLCMFARVVIAQVILIFFM